MANYQVIIMYLLFFLLLEGALANDVSPLYDTSAGELYQLIRGMVAALIILVPMKLVSFLYSLALQLLGTAKRHPGGTAIVTIVVLWTFLRPRIGRRAVAGMIDRVARRARARLLRGRRP